MLKPRINLMGAFARGLVAGLAGAGAQTLFFKFAKKHPPHSSNGATASSTPPEEKPAEEKKPGTAVRHMIGRWLLDQPLLGGHAATRGGEIVHYALGAAWGGAYALTRESRSALVHGPLGATGFCATLSMLSQHMMLPAFQSWQAAGKDHHCAWTGDMVYGLVVPAVYEAMRPQSWTEAGSKFWIYRMKHDLASRLPGELHPAIGPVVDAVAALRELASAIRSRVRESYS